MFNELDFQSMDPSIKTTRSCLLHTNNNELVKMIMGEKSRLYHCIPFNNFRASQKICIMKSKQYETYLGLCHGNSLFNADWMLCSYTFNVTCTLSKGITLIDTENSVKIGSASTCEPMANTTAYWSVTRFRRQMQGWNITSMCFGDYSWLPTDEVCWRAWRNFKICQIHFQSKSNSPLCCTHKQEVLHADNGSFLYSLKRMILECLISFAKYLKNKLMSSGRAVSIDGVILKVQSRHFLDFTVHQMDVGKGKSARMTDIFNNLEYSSVYQMSWCWQRY